MVARIEITEDRDMDGTWRVEFFEMELEGNCCTVTFSGERAEERAKEYYTFQIGKGV